MHSIISVIVVVVSMLCTSLKAEHIGLVLAGGGAKGAYEVGVWQALEKEGVASNITVISGTSVGAINAALFAVCPNNAEKLWLENMKDIFVLNTNQINKVLHKKDEQISEFWKKRGPILSPRELREAWRDLMWLIMIDSASNIINDVVSSDPGEGFLDSSPLASAINEAIPQKWPESTPFVYVTSLQKGTEPQATTWRLNNQPHEERIKKLLASCAIPVAFSSVPIDNNNYMDGGWEGNGGDNVPLIPILKSHPDVKKVIIVYLGDEKHLRMDRREKNRKLAEEAGVGLVEIIPSEDISGWFGVGGTFNASPETAHRLIELGRKDAEAKLRESLLAR